MLFPKFGSGCEAARVHHSSGRRCDGGVATCGTRAAGGDAGNQRIIRIRACRCVEDAAAKQRSPTPAQVHIAEGSARIGDAQPAIPPPIRHALLMGAKAPVEISDSHDAMRTMAESGAGCSSHWPQHNQQAPAHLVCIPLSFEA
jgi:hypothetical protein